MQFAGIRSEGGLLPLNILEQIAEEKLEGQKASAFGLPAGRRLTDEIARAWSDAQAYWKVFTGRWDDLPEKDSFGTTLTRERWVTRLLQDLLGYELTYQPAAAVVNGKNYAISHRAGSGQQAPPVHIEGFKIDLDKRPESRRLSPQALLQEYLNNSEDHLWGIVTNGIQLRLLRDTSRTSRPTYLEFNLQSILEGSNFNEFALFYRLCHRTRLPKEGEDGSKCLLETYFQTGIEQGGRVRDHLRDGVEEALKLLGSGFLQHPRNHELLERARSGRLTPQEYHRQLLRLVYRLLFLMVSEERHLILPDEPESQRRWRIYSQNYGIHRLRVLAEGHVEKSNFSDLWLSLKKTFQLFQDGDANPLGIPPLNGDLFSSISMRDLDGTYLYNDSLLEAMRNLSVFRDGRNLQRINYSALDVEELGSVYESLLDFQPVLDQREGVFKFDLRTGSERKSTGSYYTRPELVRELIQSALVPVMEDRLAEARKKAGDDKSKQREAQIDAILSMSVCDPACGSGHFLLAAARRLGRELAKIKTGEEEPTPKEFHLAVREVISHCIYGVDLNPLAVDLCKLALWLEGHWTGKPLSFLDHRIKCGNSLIGVLDPKVLEEGIPNGAFKPVTGDDKEVAKAFKKRNRDERRGQPSLPFDAAENVHDYATEYHKLSGIREETPSGVRAKAEAYQTWRGRKDWWHDWTACNIWTAAFFVPLTEFDDPTVPTHERFLRFAQRHDSQPQTGAAANALAEHLRFFHWRLEFPEIFEQGGLDVVLGNPPWDTLQPEEIKFFAAQGMREIAELPGDNRKQAIQGLSATKPELAAAWKRHQRFFETTNKFIRESDRFRLTAAGKVNTYPLFAEMGLGLINKVGRAGVIVPTGIATDDSCKDFFGAVSESHTLVSMFDFENSKGIFPSVHRSYKFSALTLSGKPVDDPQFAFFLSDFADLHDTARFFSLRSEDLALLNPNTHTCPTFRTKYDALLTRKLYQSTPVLNNHRTGTRPWGSRLQQGLFNMTSDSELFATEPGKARLRLYESKMFHQFDHRWSTYDHGEFRDVTPGEKINSDFTAQSRYWVQSDEVKLRAADVPPSVVQAVRAQSEEMARAALLPWWAGYAAAEARTADAESLIDQSVNINFSKLDVRHELIQYICNSAAARKLQERWPLSSPDMSAILHCRNYLESAEILIDARCPRWFIAFRDIARSTDERTSIFSFLPFCGVGNNAPLTFLQPREWRLHACFVANMNSLIFDFTARQKVGGTHMNFFIVEQLPVLPPELYLDDDKLEIAERTLRVVFSSTDLSPLGSAAGKALPAPLTRDEISQIRADLDAYYAHLYRLTRDELRYILDPKDVFGDDFPSETFRVLKEREENEFGEYRTGRLVLEAFDNLAESPRFKDEMPKRVSAFEVPKAAATGHS